MKNGLLARIPLLVSVLFFGWAVANGAGAAGTELALFQEASAPSGARALAQNVLRQRYVTLTSHDLGAAVRLELFEDVEVLVRHRMTDTNALGGNVWIGTPEEGEGEIFLSRVGEVTVGNIWLNGRMFELRYEASGVHLIREIDPSQFPDELCDSGPDFGESTTVDLGAQDPTEGAGIAVPRGAASDGCGVIDVMVLYTPAALASAGDEAAMEALIHMAFSVTNLSMVDSNVNPRFSPVHIDEIDYTEAGTVDPDADVFDDRDALRSTNDNLMDEVHALRDRYCADIVHLITDFSNQVNPDNEWCGAAYIQQNAPDPNHETSGFAVTIDGCAVGNRTFAHEMGHTMGAQHDWYKDDSVDPYAYAHGYVNRAEKWRTIMAYNSECKDAGSFTCARKGYWSNPGVDFMGNPTGISEGTDTSCAKDNLSNPDCDAENWRVLNNTACTVANFRKRSECTSSQARNVWMKDTWFDTGQEPDPYTVGQKMWKSPYIWVRRIFDATGRYQHLHQNPEFGSTNWVYVKLHNDFDVAATGQLRLYYAEAATGLQWPADWTEFASVPVNIAAHTTLLQPTSWGPPGTGHFCLLARWDSPTAPADPMTFPEGASVKVNTRNNNNIVWRNVNVADLFSSEQWLAPPVDMQNLDTANQFVTLEVELPDVQDNFLRKGGRLWIDLGSALAAWQAGGGAGGGILVVNHPTFGTVVEILDTTDGIASIDRLQLPPLQRVPIQLIAEAPIVPFSPNFPPVDDDPPSSSGPTADGQTIPDQPLNTFAVDLVQIQGGEEVGGVGYEIHVTPTSNGVGAVPDGDAIPGVPLTVDRLPAGIELNWGGSCQPSDVDYAVYAGNIGEFTSHVPATCSTNGATSATLPADESDLYYLVVPTDLAADGSYGADSDGAERPESLAACRLRITTSCPGS